MLTSIEMDVILLKIENNQIITKGVAEMQTNYKLIKQVIEGLSMMNNKFMNLMLDENVSAAQIMLRVILKDDKIKVKNVRIQRFIQNIYGHSAQLDILAEDGFGRYFNVEVQRSDEGASVRRARFYSSVLDTQFLQANRDYNELPDSYIIFITENDVFKKGLPLYSVERVIKEESSDFSDGSYIVYVNSNCRDNTALGKLMQDLYCTEPAKLHYKEFAERMEFLKCSKEGEEKMTDIIELYAQNVAEQAAKQAAKETVHKKSVEVALSLLADGMSIDFAAKHSKLTVEEVRRLAEKRTA